MLFILIHDCIKKKYKGCHMTIHDVSHVSCASTSIIIHWDDEGTSFMTFVWGSLYPKGDNALKDEGL
jgi:hypothetical protein